MAGLECVAMNGAVKEAMVWVKKDIKEAEEECEDDKMEKLDWLRVK